MNALITDVELAERFNLTVEQLHDQRRKQSWPCVKFGRFEFRWTEEQVDQIIRAQSYAGRKPVAGDSGLTERSARKAS